MTEDICYCYCCRNLLFADQYCVHVGMDNFKKKKHLKTNFENFLSIHIIGIGIEQENQMDVKKGQRE